MAFEPVRLTHPSNKLDDVTAYTPVEFNDFRYRDGYVVAKETETDSEEQAAETDAVVASETDTPGVPDVPAPTRPETAAEKKKRLQEEAKTPKVEAPVVGDGTTVA